MSENKCPCCESDMRKTTLGDVYAWYTCHDDMCAFNCRADHLPRIAAAMDLAIAGVWAEECEEQRDYMEDETATHDAWRSIVNLDIDANEAACKALERCKEVFNAERFEHDKSDT